jgi:predicted SAM-dependent methyltransferase
MNMVRMQDNYPEISQMTNVSHQQVPGQIRKLEIGSGNRPREGYEHLDFDPACPHLEYCADFRKLEFIEGGSFDEILAVHCIEHIPWREVRATLAGWTRLLKPGGLIRVETPNLRFICEMYLQDANAWMKDYGVMMPEEQGHLQLNQVPNRGLWANFKLFSSGAGLDKHYACLDADLLSGYLKDAGCASVRVISDGESLIVDARK